MKSIKRRLVSGLAIALALGAAAIGTEKTASAQEILITGPLAGAPAVRKMRQYRQGRFEIAPTVSFTLLDEYRRTILTGARLQYNITEWLGIGVWGAYGVLSTTTDLTDQIDNTSVRNSRTATNVNHGVDAAGDFTKRPFGDQTAKMSWVAAPQIQFTPFRGKLALFQKIFVDTDAYLHGGLAFVGLQERENCGANNQPACTDPGSFTLASRTALAPTFGLGLNFFTSDLISLGVEYRALLFSWNRAGFDSRGQGGSQFPDGKIDSNDATFKFNQMVTISLGFGLPSHPHISD